LARCLKRSRTRSRCIDEAIQSIRSIKQITSPTAKYTSSVLVELEPGDTPRAIIDISISGQADEFNLKALAGQVHNDLSTNPEVSRIEMVNTWPYAISTPRRRRGSRPYPQVGGTEPPSSLGEKRSPPCYEVVGRITKVTVRRQDPQAM